MESQYTNEDLVRKIQAGDQSRMGLLWKQVEKLVSLLAKRYMITHELPGTVEFCDLYNAGYLALANAVATYDPDRGLFSSWLYIYLRNEFNYAAGITPKQCKDAMHNALSLSQEVKGGGEIALGDTVPDLVVAEMLEAVEQEVYLVDLHKALDTALELLPKEESEAIRMEYYQSRSIQEIADSFHCEPSCIYGRRHRALYKLRTQKSARQLRSFLEFDYYSGTGLDSFRTTGMSIQEKYIVYLENANDSSKGKK